MIGNFVSIVSSTVLFAIFFYFLFIANGWKIVYIAFNIFPSMMILYQAITIVSLFVPITGRIGSDKNPEIIIGVIVMVLTIIFSSFYVSYSLLST